MGISVKRIWGQDRYETSVNVAKELGASNGVFVVSGEHYEDALSVAPIADKLQYPIILTSKDSVPDIVKNYVNNMKNNGGKVEVIGGDDVLNSNVISTLNTTKTYNQSSKYDRNLALINNYKGQLDLSKVYIASDKGFADALSGSALAGQNGNPIILVGDSNQSTVNSFISNSNISNVNVLGGTGVLSNYVVNSIIGSTTATDTGNSIVTFKDKNLEKVVRNAIKKSTGYIYISDVENITSLEARENGIQDISGIENLTNLQTLELIGNKISNIGALKGLTNLRSINLAGNQISDIRPLEGLTNLKLIDLAVNKISDIGALEGLTNLQEISLNNNQISDMSALKGSINLDNLGICMNKISDISALKGLTNLKNVDLSENKISNVNPLKELTNLESLVLNENQISNIRPLQGLTNLQCIYLNRNQISDISPLKELTNLKILELDKNQVSDINVLKELTNLKCIWLYDNPISDYDKKALSNALPKCDISYSKTK